LLGFGKSVRLLKTRDVEQDLNGLFLNVETDDEVWIITPYATMDKLTALRRIISETAARGVNISFVIRDEPEQVKPAKKHLKEAIENGLKLYSFHRLHAKVYWFEFNGSILTSANLVDGSFESSTEIGLGIEPGKLHDDIRIWIEDVIKPEIKLISNPPKVKELTKKQRIPKKTKANGHCIRCKKSISFNPEKPYCLPHYKSWAKYENPEYEEEYCHKCGKPNHSSMEKPVCYSCFKSAK
jgi:hypothetical protein